MSQIICIGQSLGKEFNYSYIKFILACIKSLQNIYKFSNLKTIVEHIFLNDVFFYINVFWS